jgi:1-acyl-sn-glycerol-3-phosphate acyltransferase
VRSGPEAARTILLFHILGAGPSKQPLMVRTCSAFLKVYGDWLLFFVSGRTNKRHHHLQGPRLFFVFIFQTATSGPTSE